MAGGKQRSDVDLIEVTCQCIECRNKGKKVIKHESPFLCWETEWKLVLFNMLGRLRGKQVFGFLK